MPTKCYCYVTTLGVMGIMISENKVKVFRLPQNQEERKKWIKSIPRVNAPDKPDTVICEKHFPVGYATIIVKGKERPGTPPSIFPNIPSSLNPTPAAKPREKKNPVQLRSTVCPIKSGYQLNFFFSGRYGGYQLCIFFHLKDMLYSRS